MKFNMKNFITSLQSFFIVFTICLKTIKSSSVIWLERVIKFYSFSLHFAIFFLSLRFFFWACVRDPLEEMGQYIIPKVLFKLVWVIKNKLLFSIYYLTAGLVTLIDEIIYNELEGLLCLLLPAIFICILIALELSFKGFLFIVRFFSLEILHCFIVLFEIELIRSLLKFIFFEPHFLPYYVLIDYNVMVFFLFLILFTGLIKKLPK